MLQELVYRAVACLLTLLVCSSVPGTSLRNSKMIINRPRNGQVVTRQFPLSVILPEQVDAEATYALNSKNCATIGVSVNGELLYKGSGHVYRFDSIMYIAKPTEGNVAITVFQVDNSNNILASSTITVTVLDSDSQFIRRVEQTLLWADPHTRSPGSTIYNGHEYHQTQSSHLFVGLGTGIIARLSMLRPHKATVLDLNANACAVLGGVEIVHCVSPSRPLDLTHSLYFDVAIVSYPDMVRICQDSLESSMGVSVETLYQTIVHMTRGSVWMLVPHAETLDITSYWNTHLRRLHQRLHPVELSKEFFTNITLSEYNKIETMEGLLSVPIEEVLHLHGVNIFVQQCNTINGSKTNHAQVGESGTSTENDSQTRVSTIISSDFTLGRVHVHIQNVCFLNDGRTVVVFTQPRGAELSVWDELIALYTQDENNGFQFTTIRLIEVPLTVNPDDPASPLTATARHLLEHTNWETGLSAVPYSPVTGHIVHQIEALLQLLDCNHYVHTVWADKNGDGDEDRAVWLVRLLFPTMLSNKINDWLTTVISLVLAFSAEKCPRRDGILPGASRVSANLHPARRTPAVYLRNHLFNTTSADPSDHFSIIRVRPRTAHEPRRVNQEMSETTLQGVKCYKDLLVLGRTNTHVKFFPSATIGRQFRDFVYEHMQVKVRSYCETFCNIERDDNTSVPPLACPPVSMECTMHIYREQCPCEPALNPTVQYESQENTIRYRKLRVTISLRTASRRILNLPALTDAMLATGLVHKEWLMSHILVLESLPFTEQVSVYAETDVLICVHGAAAINGIFMQSGSVVFEIFNGRFVEFVFAPPLREVGVHYLYTYVRDHAAQTAGCDDVPAKCLQGSVYAAASIDCVRIRTCSVRVDVTDFELVFMQAYYHVLSDKWHGGDESVLQTTEPGVPMTESTDSTENVNLTAREIQAVYLAHVKHTRFQEALDTAQLLLPTIDSLEWSPIYFLELGVICYGLGDHLHAYQHCQRALQHVDQAVWGVDIAIQINACLGAAGTYLEDLSVAGEHVIQHFLSAWELSVNKARPFSDSSAGHHAEKGARWGLCSTMMAAPLDSLEYNLLRSFERFGRYAECLDWYLSTLHLPSLLEGGAYIIAYAIVEWSPARRADIDYLEQQLRLSGALLLPVEVTLWDEIRRVQTEGKHSIAGASQCLDKYITSLDASIHMKDVSVAMLNFILREPHRGPDSPPVPQLMNDIEDCRLVLITQFYIHPDPQKNSDLLEVLQRNLDNPFLSALYLVNEQEFDFSRLNNSSKIVQFVSGKRLTFQDAFLLINQYENASTVIIANSDIYFDETLRRLARCGSDVSKSALLGPDQAFALLKWTSDRDDPAQRLRITLRTDSQDAWVFRAPMRSHVVQHADFYLGQPKCDNRMVALLQEAQYRVSNPAFAIHAIELSYPTGTVIYANNEAVVGNVSDLLLSDEMYF